MEVQAGQRVDRPADRRGSSIVTGHVVPMAPAAGRAADVLVVTVHVDQAADHTAHTNKNALRIAVASRGLGPTDAERLSGIPGSRLPRGPGFEAADKAFCHN